MFRYIDPIRGKVNVVSYKKFLVRAYSREVGKGAKKWRIRLSIFVRC